MRKQVLGETRKDYLFRVALAYLKEIKKSYHADTLGVEVMYDGRLHNGYHVIKDMNRGRH